MNNNTVIIAGKVRRIAFFNGNNREIASLTIQTPSIGYNGKSFYSYIPVTITMPKMVEKCKTLKEGQKVVIEGRFETYQGQGSIKSHISEVTQLQLMDQGYINMAFLWGRLTNDPQIKTTASGEQVAHFSVANSRSYKKGEEWVEVTSYVRIQAWNNMIPIAEQIRKGNAVWITGNVSTGSYTNAEGKKIYTMDIRALNIIYGGTGKMNMMEDEQGNVYQLAHPQNNQQYNPGYGYQQAENYQQKSVQGGYQKQPSQNGQAGNVQQHNSHQQNTQTAGGATQSQQHQQPVQPQAQETYQQAQDCQPEPYYQPVDYIPDSDPYMGNYPPFLPEDFDQSANQPNGGLPAFPGKGIPKEPEQQIQQNYTPAGRQTDNTENTENINDTPQNNSQTQNAQPTGGYMQTPQYQHPVQQPQETYQPMQGQTSQPPQKPTSFPADVSGFMNLDEFDEDEELPFP